MTRKTTLLSLVVLAMAGPMIGARPAQAFCIENKSPYSLRVHMETSNPFGKFAVLFKPGDKGCCSWFSQRCNPTRTPDGILTFSVRSKAKAKKKLYCTSGWARQVYGTASGNIVITEKPGSLGGLKCDSRDINQRPVTQQTLLKRRKKGMPPPIVVPPPPS